MADTLIALRRMKVGEQPKLDGKGEPVLKNIMRAGSPVSVEVKEAIYVNPGEELPAEAWSWQNLNDLIESDWVERVSDRKKSDGSSGSGVDEEKYLALLGRVASCEARIHALERIITHDVRQPLTPEEKSEETDNSQVMGEQPGRKALPGGRGPAQGRAGKTGR